MQHLRLISRRSLPSPHGPRRRFGIVLAGLLATVLLSLPAVTHANEVWFVEGETAGDEFGRALARIPDVNSDTVDDLVVAAPAFDGLAGADSGKVYVLSGADGSVIRAFEGEGAGDRFGSALAARGGLILVGAPLHDVGGFTDAGKAYVYVAATGALAFEFDGDFAFDQLGAAVAFSDTSADATADFVLGAPNYNAAPGPNSGRVTVRSGIDGSLLHTIDGNNEDDNFGSAVANAGLIDADANEDLILGAPGFDGAAGVDSGRAYLVSGDLAATLRLFDGPTAGANFGASVDGAGNLDSDSVDDVLVGGPFDDSRGIARGFSGDTGATLLSKVGERTLDSFGAAVAFVEDIDSDGEQEVLVGATLVDGPKGIESGKAYLYSGSTGNLLMVFNGETAGEMRGTAVAGLGDVDADAFPDVVTGEPLADTTAGADAGRVTVLSGNPVKHCNKGNVNWAADDIQDVLFLNGTVGGAERRVSAAEGERLWGAIVKPPAGGNGKYLIQAHDRTATFATISIVPKNIGTSCFQVLLPLGGMPLAVWNTVGKESKVGDDMYFDGSPLPDPPTASAVFFKRTQGDPVNLPIGTVVTFQGVIIDPATASNGGASLINSVILAIE